MGSFTSLVIGTIGTATFSGSLTPAGATYRLGGGGGVLTFATALTGGNSLVAFGGGSGGTLILSGSNSYTGATTIGSSGTLEFSGAANQTLSGNISGGGALVDDGPRHVDPEREQHLHGRHDRQRRHARAGRGRPAGVILGNLTINSGGTVNADANSGAWDMAPATCVSGIAINGGRARL